ncbi:MAG: lipopolysaccharide biosynthesis protein [Terriglobales bacterium]|jgi:O-antigen/teichoic acid export membrane protein
MLKSLSSSTRNIWLQPLDTNATAKATAFPGDNATGISAHNDGSRADPRRHQHWDVRNFFSNYGYLLTGNALNALFSFLNIWLATHALGSSGYGAVAALMAAGQAVLTIAVNWTAVSLFRFGAQEFVASGKIAESFWTRGSIALVNLAALLATYPLWAGFLLSHYHLTRSDSWLLGAFVCSTALSVQMLYALQASKRPRQSAIVLLLERVLVFAALLGIVATHAASIKTVVSAYVAGALIACSTGMLLLRHQLSPILLKTAVAVKMVWYSVPMMANGVVGFFSSNFIDAFFILKYLSLAALGIYAVGFQYAGVLMQLPTLAGSLLLPFYVTQLAHGREDRIRRFLLHAHPMATLLWSLICVFAGAFGAAVVPRLLGHQFAEVGKVIWPLLIANAAAGPVLLGLGTLANAQDKTYKSAIGALVTASVNVALDIFLIPRFGEAGCAWATTAAYTAGLLVWLLMSARYCAPLRVLIGLFPICAAYGAVTFGYRGLWPVIFGTAGFALVAWLGRAELTENIGSLREAWAKVEEPPPEVVI